MTPHLYRRSHTYTGQGPSRKPAALIPLVGRIQGGKHRGDIRECGSSFLYVAQLSHSYPMWDLD